MAIKKSGLGKGLDSLITNKVNKPIESAVAIDKINEAVLVSIAKVEPNEEQPRKKFDEDALVELAESIKQFGVLQPLLVQAKGNYYEIIAGERRWRAAKLAGLKDVPVIIKDLTEQQKMEIALIENIQRENLNPIEEAQAYKKLITEFHLKQDDVAERVSKSRTAVANTMRLLKLNEDVQQMVNDEMLTTGHARALLGIEDEQRQYELAMKIFDEKLNVRDTEKMVRNLLSEKKGNKADVPRIDTTLDAIYRNLEEELKAILGTKVSINAKDNRKGKLEIEYYSQEELDSIIDLLRTVER